ncbi:MAG: dehydrogenase [Cellvibrionaceae bacterium]|nr:dehydrogenase [Cellvibrionaceae bacterium]
MNQFQYCTQQLAALLAQISQQPPFNTPAPAQLRDSDQRFLNTLSSMVKQPGGEQFYTNGQWLISHAVANYPEITPQIPRDLFWFFGGDCLHYMPDEEISRFQALDDACHNNPETTYQDHRAKILGLH